jgi:hypothetical protein
MALGLAPRRIPILIALGCCAALPLAAAPGPPAGAAQRPCRDLPVRTGSYTQSRTDGFGRERALITFTSFCISYGRHRNHWGNEIFGFDGSVACENFNDFDDGRLGDALSHRPHTIIRHGAPRKFHVHYRLSKDPNDPEGFAVIDIRARFRARGGPAVGTLHYLGPPPPPGYGPRCDVTSPFQATRDRSGAQP